MILYTHPIYKCICIHRSMLNSKVSRNNILTTFNIFRYFLFRYAMSFHLMCIWIWVLVKKKKVRTVLESFKKSVTRIITKSTTKRRSLPVIHCLKNTFLQKAEHFYSVCTWISHLINHGDCSILWTFCFFLLIFRLFIIRRMSQRRREKIKVWRNSEQELIEYQSQV